MADISGGMYAFSVDSGGAVSARATGEGAAIRISLFDSIMEWMSPLSLMATHGPHPQARRGASRQHRALRAVLGGGGRQVVLAVQNEREWLRLCEQVLERPELATDPRFSGNEKRLANRLALEPLIEEALIAVQPSRRRRQALEAAQVPYSRMNDVAEVLNHPQVLSRDRLLETGLPGGQHAERAARAVQHRRAGRDAIGRPGSRAAHGRGAFGARLRRLEKSRRCIASGAV